MAPFHHRSFKKPITNAFPFQKNWIGSSLRLEDNQEKSKTTNQFSALSQNLQSMAFSGRGDSTKIFVELGYLRRTNDSLQSQSAGNRIQRVNSSQAFRLKSKLIQTNKTIYLFMQIIES
jgi:hypothetical protein